MAAEPRVERSAITWEEMAANAEALIELTQVNLAAKANLRRALFEDLEPQWEVECAAGGLLGPSPGHDEIPHVSLRVDRREHCSLKRRWAEFGCVDASEKILLGEYRSTRLVEPAYAHVLPDAGFERTV